MAEAAAAVRRAGCPCRGRLLLTGVIDEEGAGLGARRLVEQGIRADCAVITEPTELGLVRVSNGQVNLELLVRGQSAHGSSPESGKNAIEAAARIIMALGDQARRLRARVHPLIGPTTLNVGTIHGGLVTSIVPAECRVTLDRRVIPGDTVDSAIADLDELLHQLRAADPSLEVERRVMMAVPPVEVPEDLPLCRIIRDATARVLGKDLGFRDAGQYRRGHIPVGRHPDPHLRPWQPLEGRPSRERVGAAGGAVLRHAHPGAERRALPGLTTCLSRPPARSGRPPARHSLRRTHDST